MFMSVCVVPNAVWLFLCCKCVLMTGNKKKKKKDKAGE